MQKILLLLCCLFPLQAHAAVRCLPDVTCGNYDIIVVAGQSNATSRGLTRGQYPQFNNDRIWQIGRRSIPGAVVPASEPLESITYATSGKGFALPFARHYRDAFLAKDRRILIIPTAKGAMAVVGKDAYWKPDGEGVRETRSLITESLAAFPNSRVVAVLWHQGESDAGSPVPLYTSELTKTLNAIRGKHPVPLLLGGMSPSIVATSKKTAAIQSAIADVASTLPMAAYVSPDGLESYGLMPAGNQDLAHFTAESQLELGERYFKAFSAIRAASAPAQRSK